LLAIELRLRLSDVPEAIVLEELLPVIILVFELEFPCSGGGKLVGRFEEPAGREESNKESEEEGLGREVKQFELEVRA